MRKTWTDSDAQRLKALREQAGTSHAAFAKRHSLSIGQVRELEGGSTGSFYSEDIKAHAGRRLLAALGYVAPAEPEPAAGPPIQPTPADRPEPVAETEALVTAVPPIEAAPPPAPAENQPGPEAMAPSAQSTPSTPSTLNAPRRSVSPAWVLLAIAAIGGVAVVSIRGTPTVTVATVTTPVAAPALAAQAASEPAAAVHEAPAQEATPAASATPAQASVAASAPKPKLPADCELAKAREATPYQSPVADKPATYVHVESIQSARVCVFDSQNQARVAVLKAGESINVYGAAPFTIRSAQWNDLRVFFQGRRVQLEPGAASDSVVILPRRDG